MLFCHEGWTDKEGKRYADDGRHGMRGVSYEMRSGLDLLCTGYESFVWFSILIVNELYMWSRCAFDGVIIRREKKGAS